MNELVSVILPTHNEAANLAGAIRSVRAEGPVEVIVADGGSTDATLSLARQLADTVVQAPRNRATQLNSGAAAARGSILLFLHADSCLAPGSVDAARRALNRPGVDGGAFTLRIGTGTGGLRWISWVANLRSRFLGLPYGDQALFIRTGTFRELGGFRPVAIMEDVDLVRRLRRIGRMALIDLPVETSARRFQTHGLLRTTFANAAALAMFQLGVAPLRIRRFYDSLLKAPVHGHGT